ncbi:ATP-binding protein [Deinococcus cavernae]|uniref:ATP-binding protein n=1 Tax=Deinococcus cavernae TaxID=2320857 RepID=UPI001F3A3AA6|nr:ATP-binding protein [Deinococcus cavernae]
MKTDPTLLPPTYLGGPAIDRDNCEREPIHIPGSVQPHGALLVVDARSGLILQVSDNVHDYLGSRTEDLLGADLQDVLDGVTLQQLQDALPPGVPDSLQYRLTWAAPRRPGLLALTAHRVSSAGQERFIVELEPTTPQDATGPQALRNAVFALEATASVTELAQVAVEAVREITGFDRVMLYRFEPDDSGLVIAEARRPDMHSFLDHRFPESDIPRQARALYVRHLLRLTADVDAPAAPLIPVLDPQTIAPTPLGGAVLRATSPIHLQYLRNMGVASSLSVSVVVEGRLWGLIACHHQTPLVVAPEARTALDYLGRLVGLQVRLKHRAETDAFRQGLGERHRALIEVAARTAHPLDTFSAPDLDLPGFMRAGGVILSFEGGWRTLGQVPDAAFIEALLAWLPTREESVWATDTLQEAFPAAQGQTQASGVLAISIGRGWQEAVVWLRPEVELVIPWGGATPENAKGEMGPRASFDTYRQQVRGHSRPWHPGEIEEAQALQLSLTSTLGERLQGLRELNAALTLSVGEWQQFAFVMSHDMQEPVRRLSQFADLITARYGGTLDARGGEMLRHLRQESIRLRTLLRDLHSYVEVMTEPVLTRSAVDLNAALARARADTPELEQAGTEVRVPVPLPTVYANERRVTELLSHLLRNAATHGGPQVTVQAARQPHAWHLTVQDNGPGIAPEYHQRIFKLMQHLDRPGTSRDEALGQGLGLTLALGIARAHHGTLTVASAPGQGAAFTFVLPDERGSA